MSRTQPLSHNFFGSIMTTRDTKVDISNESMQQNARRDNKRTIKKRTKSKKTKEVSKRGRWAIEEKKAFLRGLRRYGKGQWKAIAKTIPNRTTIQVKTHAQMVLKKINSGEDVFCILEDNTSEEVGSKHPTVKECCFLNIDNDQDDPSIKNITLSSTQSCPRSTVERITPNKDQANRKIQEPLSFCTSRYGEAEMYSPEDKFPPLPDLVIRTNYSSAEEDEESTTRMSSTIKMQDITSSPYHSNKSEDDASERSTSVLAFPHSDMEIAKVLLKLSSPNSDDIWHENKMVRVSSHSNFGVFTCL